MVVPTASLAEAALVDGVQVHGATCLKGYSAGCVILSSGWRIPVRCARRRRQRRSLMTWPMCWNRATPGGQWRSPPRAVTICC